jgi:AcrR family transcriptional regulator
MNDDSVSATVTRKSAQRRTRRREKTRTALLSAARTVFATRGYLDGSIADITTAADVAVGTFYLYFPDKEALLHSLLEEGMQRARGRLLAATAAAQPEQILPVLLRTIFEAAYEDRELFGIALQSRPRLGMEFLQRSALLSVLLQVLESASRRGLLPGYDPALLARLISGIVVQGVAWWLFQEEPHPDPGGMTEQVLHLLRDGLSPSILGGATSTSSTAANETLE